MLFILLQLFISKAIPESGIGVRFTAVKKREITQPRYGLRSIDSLAAIRGFLCGSFDCWSSSIATLKL